METEGEDLAYCCIVDKVLGTGVKPDSSDAQDPGRWSGLNILGQCLMKIRHWILNNSEFQQDVAKIRQEKLNRFAHVQKNTGILGKLMIDEEPNDLSEGKQKVTLQKYAME